MEELNANNELYIEKLKDVAVNREAYRGISIQDAQRIIHEMVETRRKDNELK